MEDGKLFSINQEVTPVPGPWYIFSGQGNDRSTPKMGEIYHVRRYDWDDQCGWLISLRELNPKNWYDQNGFAPVLTDDQLIEMIREEVAV